MKRNRRHISVIILMLMLCLLAACAEMNGGMGPTDDPVVSEGPPFFPFSSLKYGYMIDIPNGFDMEGMEGKLTSWSYIPSVEEGDTPPGPIAPRISVVVTDIPSGYSSRSLFDAKSALITRDMNEPDSTLRDFKVVEYPAGYALMVDDIDKTDRYAENHRFYYLYVGKTSYLVDISGTASDLKQWENSFNHVIESFQVIK